MTLAGLGITGVLLSQAREPLGIPTVMATSNGVFDNVIVDNDTKNNGASLTPGVQFNSGGEGVASNRTTSANGNLFGLDFWVNETKAMSITNPTQSAYGTVPFVGIGTQAPQALLHVSGTTPNILLGDSRNIIEAGVVGGTVSGGTGNGVEGTYGSVGGGYENVATGQYGSVGGGYGNVAGTYGSVGGGQGNQASGQYGSVGGGWDNGASGPGAFVGGGGFDGATTAGNMAGGNAATIGGGLGNTASGGNYVTIGGGYKNTTSAHDATVAGGSSNTASGQGATVGGGGWDGGTTLGNVAGGNAATIAGGLGNTAGGNYASVPGGNGNAAAGAYSFAAGNMAQVGSTHSGTFLFGDSSTFNFPSTAANQFAARATGGVRFVTGIDGSGNPLAADTFVMTNTGMLGVGTATPQTTLQVNGGVSVAVKTVTSAYTMLTSDFGILANASAGAFTVTLPAASNTGMLVFIKKIDTSTNVVTVSRAGTDTIEGATAEKLATKNKSFTLIAGGSGVWYIQSTAT